MANGETQGTTKTGAGADRKKRGREGERARGREDERARNNETP